MGAWQLPCLPQAPGGSNEVAGGKIKARRGAGPQQAFCRGPLLCQYLPLLGISPILVQKRDFQIFQEIFHILLRDFRGLGKISFDPCLEWVVTVR